MRRSGLAARCGDGVSTDAGSLAKDDEQVPSTSPMASPRPAASPSSRSPRVSVGAPDTLPFELSDCCCAEDTRSVQDARQQVCCCGSLCSRKSSSPPVLCSDVLAGKANYELKVVAGVLPF